MGLNTAVPHVRAAHKEDHHDAGGDRQLHVVVLDKFQCPFGPGYETVLPEFFTSKLMCGHVMLLDPPPTRGGRAVIRRAWTREAKVMASIAHGPAIRQLEPPRPADRLR